MDREYKLIYKLYQPDGTFIKTFDATDIISNFQITKNINGGVGSLLITLNKPIDNYDEYDAVKNPNGSIKYGNRVKVYLKDKYNSTPKLIFYGYLVEISPSYQNGQESVGLSFYGAVSKLSNDYYNNSGTPPYEPTEPAGFYVVETAVSASTIIKNILDNYISKTTYPMISYTWGSSIVDCANIVSYTFDRQTYLDAAKKSEEYLPVGWYWYVDEAGIMNVKDSNAQTTHKLTIGRHIKEIQAHKSISSVVNYFILWNGRSTADESYVFAYKNDTTSQTDYDRTILFQQDNDVLEDSVATIRKDKVIAYRKDPKQELTIEVSGEHYDLSTIQPGQLVSIRNIRSNTQTTFADGMIIKRVSLKISSALVELGEVGADLVSATSDEETAVQLSIKQAQSATENLQSGDTPITEANIQYLAGDFIKEDVIYSPVIAGINGYFRDSITMGQSGLASVIKSYGKTGFNDGSVGYWLEKSALNYTKLEMYYNGTNYLRFNTQTGKLEIAGDIILGPSTTITWSQISDASIPNNANLGGLGWINSAGWTDDANLNALRNGTLAGGTFITNKYIYSPIIAGASGYFRDSITVGGSGVGGVIKSYGKGTYGDGGAGFYLERTSASRVYFELYADATHYLRFDSSGSPTIQFRGGLNADDINAGTILADRIGAGTIAANKLNVANLASINADLGSITAGSIRGVTLDVSSDININVGATNVLRLNANAFIARQGKAFAAEGTPGYYTQLFTVGLNGILQITNNGSGTFGIKDDDTSEYLMKWSYYDIEIWRTVLPMVSGVDLGSATYKFDDVYCNTMKGLYGEIYLDQAGRIQVTNHFDPSGAGSYNSGGALRYWNSLNARFFTKQGGFGSFDGGVKLQNGKTVSDSEAILQMTPHPTMMSQFGVKRIDPKTIPDAVIRKASDHDGKLFPRDENDIPYTTDEKGARVDLDDGEDLGAMMSILIGAVKELTNRIILLEKTK
jgi:hypothetical protein